MPNPAAEYARLYAASAETPEQFARRMLATRPTFVLATLEAIGSWPSSEPEFRALQKLSR